MYGRAAGIGFVVAGSMLSGCATIYSPPQPPAPPVAYDGLPLIVTSAATPGIAFKDAGTVLISGFFMGLGGPASAGYQSAFMSASAAAGDPKVNAAVRPDAFNWYIASGLSARLKQEMRLGAVQVLTPDSGAAFKQSRAGQRALGLEVKTYSVGIQYLPMHWGHYRMNTETTAKLTDLATGREIFNRTCDYSSPMEVDKAPTYDEMTANNGEQVIKWLTEANRLCTTALLLDRPQTYVPADLTASAQQVPVAIKK